MSFDFFPRSESHFVQRNETVWPISVEDNTGNMPVGGFRGEAVLNELLPPTDDGQQDVTISWAWCSCALKRYVMHAHSFNCLKTLRPSEFSFSFLFYNVFSPMWCLSRNVLILFVLPLATDSLACLDVKRIEIRDSNLWLYFPMVCVSLWVHHSEE